MRRKLHFSQCQQYYRFIRSRSRIMLKFSRSFDGPLFLDPSRHVNKKNKMSPILIRCFEIYQADNDKWIRIRLIDAVIWIIDFILNKRLVSVHYEHFCIVSELKMICWFSVCLVWCIFIWKIQIFVPGIISPGHLE